MSKQTETKHFCDRCDKKLPTDSNHVVIQTSKSEESYYWQRFQILIMNYHGAHNDGKQEPADLCKSCVIFLLEDALDRVRSKNERISAGVESVDMLKFNQVY